MQLQEFFDYKNRLIKDMLTDEEIVNLIDPNHNYNNPKDMVYDNVNPFELNKNSSRSQKRVRKITHRIAGNP